MNCYQPSTAETIIDSQHCVVILFKFRPTLFWIEKATENIHAVWSGVRPLWLTEFHDCGSVSRSKFMMSIEPSLHHAHKQNWDNIQYIQHIPTVIMSDYQMMLVYVIQSKYMYTKYTQQYNYTHTVTFCWVGTRNGIFSMKPHSSNPNPARLMLTMEKWLFSRWTWVSRYLLRQRMMDVCGDSCSYRSCKAPVKSSPTNQHQVFYRPDALPIAQPTVSKHWRENITSYGLAYPKFIWGSSNFVFGH